MKKLYMFSCAVMLAFGMAGVASASAIPFSMMIGDNDGYGFGVADNATAAWPSYPGIPSYAPYDGRSAAEATATDGTQITDVYSAIFPNYGPNPDGADVVFDLMAGSLNSAILEIDMGDFQASTNGQIDVYFNGVLQTDLFNFDDDYQFTAIHQFTLDSTAIANANTAGEFVLTLDRANSGDFIAFDYFELSGDIDPIPEPATMLLFGTGLVGLIGYNRKRFSKKN